jgi:predicted 2-oxoglutarate/Fe(II)-dependent dioxygenase YbiX
MEIQILNNLLTDSELVYLDDLVKNESKWEWLWDYDEPAKYFSAIKVDINRLKNYFDIITENGKYEIEQTAINVIDPNIQLKNSTHFDESDLSYAAYLNEDFLGGDFIYFDKNKKEHSIKPKRGLVVRINKSVLHRVNKVTEGRRFSLYTFLLLKQKNKKTLL